MSLSNIKKICFSGFSMLVLFNIIFVDIALAAKSNDEGVTLTKREVKKLKSTVSDKRRDAEFSKRDKYRHPVETLSFFAIKPNDKVAEIWPSSGWYAGVLAPYLRKRGEYHAVAFSEKAERTPQWRKRLNKTLRDKFASDPSWYGAPVMESMGFPEQTKIADDSSLDAVLTFRNVHNWMKGEYAQGVFDSMYSALKPGGILGVVEHRSYPGTPLEQMIKSGYVTEAYVIELAEKSGFVFDASSEVNANKMDEKNHRKGVWTLPPSLRLGDEDREKYLAIGESDRMTLRFIKPLSKLE